MSRYPLVSVVMPVYNAEKYLPEAIESILNQSFADFEFIIVNDGSTDGTTAILDFYRSRDRRIAVYHQNNQGVVAALNLGCRIASGKYIARMDADDISLPPRFEKQVSYLENHTDVGVLGTWIEYIDSTGRNVGYWYTPTTAGGVRFALLFGNCVAHPSVIMKKTLIENCGCYKKEALHVEDYELWLRVVKRAKITNLPEVLVRRRLLKSGICSVYGQMQEENAMNIMVKAINELLSYQVPGHVLRQLRPRNYGSMTASAKEVLLAAWYLKRLYKAYICAFPPDELELQEIREEVGKRFYFLSSYIVKRNAAVGAILFVEALLYDRKLVRRSTVVGFVKEMVRGFRFLRAQVKVCDVGRK